MFRSYIMYARLASIGTIMAIGCTVAASADAATSINGQMTDEEFEAHIDEVFEKVDSDNDGQISKSEFREELERQNPDAPTLSDEILDDIFSAFDADGDGYFTKVEYALMVSDQLNQD